MSVRCALGFVLFALGCAESAPPPPAAPVTPEPAPSSPTSPSVAASASAQPAPGSTELVPPSTPEALRVPEGPHLAWTAFAKGAQIYACGAKKGAPGQFEWTLKAPEATLFDAEGKVIGKHFAGPTWESTDGSQVVGALKAKVDSPNPSAIPWLLVEAKSNAGDGKLQHVVFVQRVDTEGGQAPASGCDKAHDHADVRVEYRATYYFYSS